MSLFKSLMIGVVFILLLGFAFQNASVQTDITIGLADYHNVPMVLVVFFSIIIGMILMFLIVITKSVSENITIFKLKKKISILEKELANLRNIDLEDEMKEIEEIESKTGNNENEN